LIAALAAALLSVFGHLHPLQAEYYAEVIAEEAYWANIDPVTLAARGWAESGYRPLTLHAGTYGIFQCRDRVVTVRAQARCGARALAYWQAWEGRCAHRAPHFYTLHYSHGYRIPRRFLGIENLKMHRVERLLERKMLAHQSRGADPGL